MKLNLKYKIFDKVHISPLKINGRIEAIYINDMGIQFNVRYFDGIKPTTCYFIEEELEEFKKEECAGFKV